MKNPGWLLILVFILIYGCSIKQPNSLIKENNIISGVPWYDTNGDTIEGHSAGMLLIGDTYYWYGEHHGKGAGNKTGVCCYSSKDLYNWKNEGIVLPKDSLPLPYRDSGVCERPKVIYNARTKQYVMWMHLDNHTYSHSYAGVAISDSPTGKFRFLKAFRPVKYDYGFKLRNGCSPLSSAEDIKRLKTIDEAGQGNTLRDMNLFVDTDSCGYVIYSSEDNTTLYIVRLSDDYTDVQRPVVMEKTWIRAIVQGCREAPAPFKYKGKYYMFTSGLTGWSPNPADIAVADSILGPWKMMGNPCIGPDANTTFYSQSTFVIHAPGKADNCFIFMADRWNGNELQKSTFVWLPFCINTDGSIQLAFISRWNLSVFDNIDSIIEKPVVSVSDKRTLKWNAVKGAAYYNIFKNGSLISFSSDTFFEIPLELAGKAYAYTVTASNLAGVSSVPSDAVVVNWTHADTTYLSAVQPESWSQGFGSPEKDRAIHQSLINIAGREFKKGIGTHSPSLLVYNTCGSYSRFTAWVGVDYYAVINNFSSIQFELYGDGKLLFKSPVMKVNDAAIPVDVSIKGVHELKLIVNDAGDGTHYDHADWADARLVP